MATRIALDLELTAPAETVFGTLATREFTERRIEREPEMAARLESFSADAHSLRWTVIGQLPSSWLPPGVNAAAEIHRTENWQADGDGYAGTLTLSTDGLPVRADGRWELRPWQDGSVLTLVMDLTVAMPIFGQTVERMVRDRMQPELQAELELLAEEFPD